MSERRQHLDTLLAPITWPWQTSIEYRQELVRSRRKAVSDVLPFLNEEESRRANEWLDAETHEGLWE